MFSDLLDRWTSLDGPVIKAAILEERAEAYESLSEHRLAIEDCTAALHALPKDVALLAARASAYSNAGMQQMALEDLASALAIDSTFAPAYRLRGGIRGDSGLLAEGLDDLTTAIRLDSGDWRAFAARGVLRRRQNDYVGAEQDYKEALRLNPADIQARCNLALLYEMTQRGELALEEYGTALKEDLEYKPSYAAACLKGRATVLRRRKEYKAAITDLRKAVKFEPGLWGAQSDLGALLRLGGDLKEAREHLHLALILNPQFTPALINMSAVEYAEGRYAESLALAEKAVATSTRSTTALEYSANAALKLNDFAKAKDSLLRSKQLHALGSEQALNLAQAKIELEEFTSAGEALNAVEADSTSTRFGLLKGLLAYRSGDEKAAIEGWSAVLKNAKSVDVAVELGFAHFDRKEFQEAKEAFRKALGIDGGSAAAHLGLALAAQELGDVSKAKKEYGTFLKLQPEMKDYYVQSSALNHRLTAVQVSALGKLSGGAVSKH